MAQLQHESILKNIESLQEKVKEATVQLADAKRGREDDNDSGEENRAKKMARKAELAKLKSEAEQELEKLKQNDPQALADLEHELELVKGAANRWTDNIFSCKDYLVKKRGMDKKESMKILGITDAFDCEYSTYFLMCCDIIMMSLC
jgi:chromosome segregation ATPase